MKSTRCKFKCNSVTDYGNDQKKVHMQAVCDDSLTENQTFSRYTPQGDLTITVNNPAAIPLFDPGKDYYLDITPAESEQG